MQCSERSSGLGCNKTSNNMSNVFITLEIKGYACKMMYNFCWNRRQSYSITPISGVIELIYVVYEGNTKSLREIISTLNKRHNSNQLITTLQVKENFVSQIWNGVCLIPLWSNICRIN